MDKNETYPLNPIAKEIAEKIKNNSIMANYKELVKERTSILGYIEEVERFSTWWSNNIATVIAYYDGYYRVFLLVYDSFYSTYRPAVFPHEYDCIYWGDGRERKKHNYLSDAKSEASWLRNELTGSYGRYIDNPILLIHPICDLYRSFDTFVTEPYVVKKYSTSYLKPFDIVSTYTTRFGFGFYHKGIYLGYIDNEFKVCQFTSKQDNTTIDKWSKFLEGEVSSYHPIIPFKNYRDIAGQIVWAKDNRFRKDDYNLANRNCEHFANMVVYGVNYSQQVYENRGKLKTRAGVHQAGIGVYGGLTTGAYLAAAPLTGGFTLIPALFSAVGSAAMMHSNVKNYAVLNNDKDYVCLKNEIRETNSLLGKKFDSETEVYENKYLQEIPPKENCRVM